MGLDSVEIVMGWEEAFGIAIPNDVAVTLRTPRAATDYILTQVESRPAAECVRQQAFFRLRRGLREAGRASLTARITPSTRLAELMPRSEWPARWAAMRAPVGDPWPKVAPFGGWWAFRHRTVADLVRRLAVADPRTRSLDGTAWTREQVACEVRRVVSDVVGAEYYDEDVEFVAELGID